MGEMVEITLKIKDQRSKYSSQQGHSSTCPVHFSAWAIPHCPLSCRCTDCPQNDIFVTVPHPTVLCLLHPPTTVFFGLYRVRLITVPHPAVPFAYCSQWSSASLALRPQPDQSRPVWEPSNRTHAPSRTELRSQITVGIRSQYSAPLKN